MSTSATCSTTSILSTTSKARPSDARVCAVTARYSTVTPDWAACALAVAMLRAKEWGLEIKTTKGRQGRKAEVTEVQLETVPLVCNTVVKVIDGPNFEGHKTTLAQLIAACHGKVEDVGTKVIIHTPVIVGDSGLSTIKFNAAYSRIEADKVTGDIGVWKFRQDGSPDLLISNGMEVEVAQVAA